MRVNGEGFDYSLIGSATEPRRKLPALIAKSFGVVEQIQRRTLSQRTAGRRLYLPARRPRHHYRELDLDELKEAVALYKDAGRVDPFERQPDSLFNLPVGDDHPVNVGGPRVPVAARVFARRV